METLITLESERLILRPIEESDVEAMFQLRSDPAEMKYWSAPAITTLEQAEELVAKGIKFSQSGEVIELMIDLKGGQRGIGTLTFHAISEKNKRGEIGYSLGAPYQGKGIMHEANCRLLNFLFFEQDFNRIEADIHPDNEASRGVLKRLGFQLEGYLPERWIVAGEVSDSEIYGLLRRNWKFAPEIMN